jgi:WD repeat-containing protein 70
MVERAMLDDELEVPLHATIKSDRIAAVLRTSSGSSVPISPHSLNQQHDDGSRRYILVGRQAVSADLRIQHGSISRRHALLYYEADNLMVRDLGGKHGTTVNDQRITAHAGVSLQHGDRILFGTVRESVFRVEVQELQESSDASDPSKPSVAMNITGQASSAPPETQPTMDSLTGRAKRQAEIAAMMASLDETPTYTVHTLPANESQDDLHPSTSKKADTDTQQVANKYRLPVTQTFVIESESDRRNAVTALAVDPSGSRFVVGTSDNKLRFYDFAGMDQGRRDSFRCVIPDDGHWPVACAFSNTGDRIIVGTGSVQPVVLDREGHEVMQFVRGDMYVTDQTKTIGHTAGVVAVDWHPLEREWVLTASLDGSARLWNLQGRTQFKKLVCDKVFSAKNDKGQRTAVTAVSFHPGGREFVLGTACGSIQIWSCSRLSSRPERVIFTAHGKGHSVAALTYNVDGTRVASRGVDDDHAKVWNATRLNRSSLPVVTCRDAGSSHDLANTAFSPDGKVLCLGVSENKMVHGKRQEVARLNFYNTDEEKAEVSPILSLDAEANCSPIIVKWHPRVSQIFVGCSDGRTLVLFDPKLSTKGALSASSKLGRSIDGLSELLKSRAPTGSAGVVGEIVTPFSLPLYRQERIDAKKRKREERKDPIMSHEPERPATGKHKTGGQTGSLNFAQFVSDQTTTKSRVIAGKDPREALFKYREGESFIDRAYEGNESKLADKTAEEEEEEYKSQRNK